METLPQPLSRFVDPVILPHPRLSPQTGSDIVDQGTQLIEGFLQKQNIPFAILKVMKNKSGLGVLGIILTIVIVLIVISGLVWIFYGKTIGTMIAIRSLDDNNGTLLNIVPTARSLSPLTAPGASTTLKYDGYIFSVPWEGISSTKGGATPTSSVSIVFASGNQFGVLGPPVSDAQMMKNIHDIGTLDPSYQIKTQYDLDNATFNVIPDQVTITTPGNDATLIALLLILKSAELITAGKLYSFNTGAIKGFQLGDPSAGREVVIYCYDSDGNRFTVVTGGTQSEIDYILASIRPQ